MKRFEPILTIIVAAFDFLAVFSAFIVAYFFRDWLNSAQLVSLSEFATFAFIVALLYLLIFAFFRMYSSGSRKDLIEQLLLAVFSSVTATMLAGAAIYFGRQFDYSRLIIGIGMLLSILFVWVLRAGFWWVEKWMFAHNKMLSRVLIIGGGGDTTLMAINGYKLERRNGYSLVGVVLLTKSGITEIESVPVVGYLDDLDLSELSDKYKLDEVVASDSIANEDVVRIVNACEELGIELKFLPDIYSSAMSRLRTDTLAGMPIITLQPTSLTGWMVVAKQIIDLVGASVGLLLLSPLLIITAIAIKLDSKGPIFFIHKRVGQFGQEFGLIKFRSMKMLEKDGKLLHAEQNEKIEKLKEQKENYKLEHDPRVTRIGHLLRKTSIDELPQLINVLKGELSLVGPRAYVRKELNTQQAKFPEAKPLVRRLLTVKPGITGLWQISGRSNVSFTERVAMDAYYATHANIWLDLKILLQTIPVVLKGSGAM